MSYISVIEFGLLDIVRISDGVCFSLVNRWFVVGVEIEEVLLFGMMWFGN